MFKTLQSVLNDSLKMSCPKSVTTSSGTFSFSEKQMTRCEAKKYCRERGQILAPITTQEDKDAVLTMFNDKCFNHYSESFYHIGLDVFPCGDTQERVFTNGVKYDAIIHGHLYADYGKPDHKCPQSYLKSLSLIRTPFIIGTKPNCFPQKHRALCLDQSTATASAVTKKKTENFEVSPTKVLVGTGGIFIVFIGSILLVVKLYKSKEKLRKENILLRNSYKL